MSSETFALCLIFLVIGGLGYLVPQLTRPELYFGVPVDPAFRQTRAGRRVLRDYRLTFWAATIVSAVVGLASHRIGMFFVLFAGGSMTAFVRARRSVLACASATRQAGLQINLSAPEERIPGGWVALSLPLVWLAGLGAWVLSHQHELPRRLPVHWRLSGPDRWVPSSPQVVLGLLLRHGLVCVVLAGAALGVFHWSRRIVTEGPAAEAERWFRRRTAWLLLAIEYFMVLPPAFTLLKAPDLAMQVWNVVLPIVLFLFVVSLARAGQGGTRLVRKPPRVGDHTADERWISRWIYFNRADPALFVEKPFFGLGWTFNFGNPWAWVLLAVIVVIPPLLHLLR